MLSEENFEVEGVVVERPTAKALAPAAAQHLIVRTALSLSRNHLVEGGGSLDHRHLHSRPRVHFCHLSALQAIVSAGDVYRW